MIIPRENVESLDHSLELGSLAAYVPGVRSRDECINVLNERYFLPPLTREESDFYVHLCNYIRINLATTKQMKRYVYPVQLDGADLENLETITENLHISKSQAIRDSVRNYAEQVKGLEVIKIREIPRSQGKKEILEFLDEHDRAWASKIADELRLDLSFVNSVLEELWSEKRVEPTGH